MSPDTSTDTWRVPLPDRAEPPFQVFVNGIQRDEGAHYHVEGRWLCFSEPLVPRPRLGGWQKFVLSLGIGVYRDLASDVVDLSYTLGGQPASATNLPIIPPLEAPGRSSPPSGPGDSSPPH